MPKHNFAVYFTLITISVIFVCFDRAQQKPAPDPVWKLIYVNQFKLVYFRQLLDKSYNSSKAVREIIESDYSGFTHPVLSENDHALIDSLTRSDNQFLIADSAQGQFRAEGADGKRPLEYILKKLSGNWLDSIANERFALSEDTGYWK